MKYFASQKMKCSACGETKRKTLRVLICIMSASIFELILQLATCNLQLAAVAPTARQTAISRTFYIKETDARRERGGRRKFCRSIVFFHFIDPDRVGGNPRQACAAGGATVALCRKHAFAQRANVGIRPEHVRLPDPTSFSVFVVFYLFHESARVQISVCRCATN